MAERMATMTKTAQALGSLAKEPIKDAVKEALREMDEEPTTAAADTGATTSDEGSGRLLFGSGLLATGVLIGYVIASRPSAPTKPIDIVKDKSPVGTETATGETVTDPTAGDEGGTGAVPRPEGGETEGEDTD